MSLEDFISRTYPDGFLLRFVCMIIGILFLATTVFTIQTVKKCTKSGNSGDDEEKGPLLNN